MIYNLPGLVQRKSRLWLCNSVADAVGLLTARGSDDEEELSEDEIIGDFVTESDESVVLSS